MSRNLSERRKGDGDMRMCFGGHMLAEKEGISKVDTSSL